MILLFDNTDSFTSVKNELPKDYVRDIISREVFPYKGWQIALKERKASEKIKARSVRQSTIFYFITVFFFKNISCKKYKFLGNEVGLKIDEDNFLCLGSTIYDRKKLPRKNIENDYLNTPPKIVFEVDVNVDTGKNSEIIYVSRKIQALLDFGVERVIWIFGENEKILVADSNKDWIITNWSTDIDVLDGHILNLQNLDLEES